MACSNLRSHIGRLYHCADYRLDQGIFNDKLAARHNPVRMGLVCHNARLAGGCGSCAQSGAIKSWPARVVRIVLPGSPGAGSDIIGRVLAQPLTKSLGQTFIIDNRPGAANIIATEVVAKSPPDGYTLLIGTTGTFITNPLVYAKLPVQHQRFRNHQQCSGCALRARHASLRAGENHCRAGGTGQRRAPRNWRWPHSASAVQRTLQASCFNP